MGGELEFPSFASRERTVFRNLNLHDVLKRRVDVAQVDCIADEGYFAR